MAENRLHVIDFSDSMGFKNISKNISETVDCKPFPNAFLISIWPVKFNSL